MSDEAAPTDPADPADREDLVDCIQSEWAHAYPQFDVRPVGLLGRIQRIAAITSGRLDRNLQRHGVSRSEFDVLGALARAPEPLRASEVVSTTMLSGASVTKLSEALVRRGLVRRGKSPRDGRVVLLELTDAGRTVVDEELPGRLADDEAALAGLTAEERTQLATLLRKITRSLGD